MASGSSKDKDSKLPPSGRSIPVRLPEWLIKKIEAAQEIRGSTQQEIIRLASEVGLAALAKVDYDVGEAVARMAMAERSEPSTVRIAHTRPEIDEGASAEDGRPLRQGGAGKAANG